jgi:hypothetical protein
MNNNFGLESLLCLATCLTGADIHAASASAHAGASVVSSTNVIGTAASYWDRIVGGDVGSVMIRVAQSGLYVANSFDDTSAPLAILGNARLTRLALARRLDFISRTGMLIGMVAVDLAVGAGDDPEPLIVMVTYN